MYNKPHIYAFADEASPSIDGQIAAMLRNHLEGLEIRNVDGQNVSDISADKAREVRRKLDDNGLVCWSIGSPIGKIEITDAFAPHLEQLKHTVEIAKILGAPNIRMFSFYMPKDQDPKAYRSQVIDQVGQMLEAAGDAVQLCHENEKGIYGDIPERCADLLTQLPDLVGVFDPANFVQCGVHPEAAWPALADRIRYLHIKDAMFADSSVVPAGHGDGHVADIVKAFLETQDPHLTIEPHLMIFSGLSGLEHDGRRTLVGKFVYETNDQAFDAACSALREIVEPLVG